jgi:hypothetical protein
MEKRPGEVHRSTCSAEVARGDLISQIRSVAEAGPPAHGWPWTLDPIRLAGALRAAAPPLLFGLRLRVSVGLALYVAFRLELGNAYWAGTSAALYASRT